MGESELSWQVRSEAELVDLAAECARRWHAAELAPLRFALSGELGAGKTTWVRAMLRGLGYRGRVPSPTFTLLEEYTAGGRPVLHLDLYRLGSPLELDNLGVRDWLADPAAWLLIEWPARAPQLAEACDLNLELSVTGPDSRTVTAHAITPTGSKALRLVAEPELNKTL